MNVFLSAAVYLRWVIVDFYIGPFSLHHWLSIAGTIFIAFFTPSYHILKRRNPRMIRSLLKLHVYGNLLAVLSISVHFSQYLGLPPDFFVAFGTGLTLYIVMITLVVTGVLQRFQIARGFGRCWRFTHISVTTTFYLVIIIHVLHGLGII